MVMDTLAGLAFSFEPPLLEYMNEYPKKKNEAIINKYMINQIFLTGMYSSLICILFLKLPLIKSLYRSDEYLYTAFFGLFIFIDIFNSFNSRTYRLNIFANIFKNKVFIFIMFIIVIVQIILIYYGGTIFRTSGLSMFEFKIMVLLALTVIPFDEIRKIILKRKGLKYGVWQLLYNVLEYDLGGVMKKFLVLIFISLLCFGCGKKSDITINIYENSSDKSQVEEKSKDVEKDLQNSSDDSTESTEETTLDSTKKSTKDKYDSAKEWYNDNKDELKEINREIIQDDIDTITNAKDKAKEWYDDNKNSIKQSAQDKYEESKNKIEELLR